MSFDCLVWLPATHHRLHDNDDFSKIRDISLKVSVLSVPIEAAVIYSAWGRVCAACPGWQS